MILSLAHPITNRSPAVPITVHQSKYLAYELAARYPSDSMEKLVGAVSGSQVEQNPCQVGVALFAYQSPLSKGAILSDKIGLGKTVEAQRNEMRFSLFEAQDTMDQRREASIKRTEDELRHPAFTHFLFTLTWSLS